MKDSKREREEEEEINNFFVVNLDQTELNSFFKKVIHKIKKIYITNLN